jgi:hypothetical protein
MIDLCKLIQQNLFLYVDCSRCVVYVHGIKIRRRHFLFFQTNIRLSDMILAVNNESFVSISYNDAKAALKGVVGRVSLLVISPAEEVAARRVMRLPRPAGSRSSYDDITSCIDGSRLEEDMHSPLENSVARGKRIEMKRDAIIGMSCVFSELSDTNEVRTRRAGNDAHALC